MSKKRLSHESSIDEQTNEVSGSKFTEERYRYLFIYIYSGYFYSASSSPLLLRGAPDIARTLCRQLRVKDLPKIPTWRLERDSSQRPFGRKTSNLPMSHHVPQ